MQRIEIETTEQKFTIDVANTDFARRWFNYAQSLSKNNFYLSGQWLMLLGRQSDKNIDLYTQELRSAIDYCAEHIKDYDFSATVSALEQFAQDQQQKHCNLIHRTFTTMTLGGHLKKYYTPELDKQVHIINSAVHKLESAAAYQTLEHRKRFNGRVLQIMFTDANRMEGVDFSMWNTPIEETFDHTIENTDYNVWLNEDILGKDLIRCFLDDDDPNNPDITGNLFLTPSLYVDIDRQYHAILSSPEFNRWHASRCPGRPLNRWPIGNIADAELLPAQHQPITGYHCYG